MLGAHNFRHHAMGRGSLLVCTLSSSLLVMEKALLAACGDFGLLACSLWKLKEVKKESTLRCTLAPATAAAWAACSRT